jgi:hypothetical protein
LAPNTSTSLQTTLAAEAHLAEGQFLLEEQTLNKAKSLMYRAGTRRPAISRIGHNNNNNNNLFLHSNSSATGTSHTASTIKLIQSEGNNTEM